MFVHLRIACSQTLYFLFKVRRARVIKNKNRGGFVNHQRKGVGVGEEEAFENEKNKTLRSVHFDVVIVELINCKCGGIVRNQIW